MRIKRFNVLLKEEGVALIAVIFLMIVMGALGMAISFMMQNQAKQTGNLLTINCADYVARAACRYAAQITADNYTGGTFSAANLPPNLGVAGAYTMPAPVGSSLTSSCSTFTLSGGVVGNAANFKCLVP